MTINFSGDLLWHNSLWESARIDGGGAMDFVPQLAALGDYVGSADLAICHSEVPFAEAGGPYGNYPMFKAPQEIAPALAEIGWDVCTTASNHSLDAGFDGLVRTIEVHNAQGILTAGTYTSAEDRATPTMFRTTSGVEVAVVSSTYGTNGIALPSEAPWSVSLLDVEDTLSQAARARTAGADIVVVHMHAGTEYESTPNRQQLDFADAMTASDDVDLVIGQHAHVVQPITRSNGKWVAYGAGNLMAQSSPAQPWTYDGYLATFTFVEQPDGGFSSTTGEFAPTMITKHRADAPARVLIVSDALAAGSWDGKQLRESAARTRTTVLSLGVEGLSER
ncbi:CapA family protein [Tessaracoccus terricola]